MLDTNIVSDLVRRPAGDIARRAAALKPGSMAISIIVAAELRYGERHGSTRLKRQLEAVLSAIEALPLTEPADQHYGRPIGHNDLLIAAHARALDATRVTKAPGEYSRVPDLAIADWLAATD